MSKKDLMERLSRASDGRTVVRRPVEPDTAAPRSGPRVGGENTRVSGRVVRRRRKASSPEVEPVVETPVVEEPPVVEVQAPIEVASVDKAETAGVEPVSETAAVAATPDVVEPVVEPPSVVEEAAAAPEVVNAPAPVPAKLAPVGESGPKFVGLGKAVVMPPPGYDPTNPTAYREQIKAQESRAAGAATTTGTASEEARRTRGRRRVETTEEARRTAAPSKRRRQPNQRHDHHMRHKRRRRSSGPKVASPQPKAIKRKVRVHNEITVGDLAGQLGVKSSAVIKQLMGMGMMVTVNEVLDLDTATLIASEFEYTVENVGFQEENFLQHVDVGDEEGALESRPPVITIMGHVDHGKTTLLDAIRDSSVADGEAGGITQHIGAYQVTRGDTVLSFIDTPGHAAFSAMRARGAQVTDIVVLVVGADDGVQPQTIEAINHSKAAGVPIIVAVNKMDKPGVNADNIKQRMSEFELVPEEWGGETLFVEVSALKRTGIDSLLETISLQAEMLDLMANSDRHADGVVLEAHMELGKGPVATVLVQSGTLCCGDYVVIGSSYGRIRSMNDWSGSKLKEAGPSVPVEVFGLSILPDVGDSLHVVENEKNARKLTEHREIIQREQGLKNTRRRTADDLFAAAGQGQSEVLYLVLKCDVAGSLQALKNAIESIEVDGTEVRILHTGVGNISESDVSLVTANEGLLIGFNVKVDTKAARYADEYGVKPFMYTVIYDILDLVTSRMKGMLAPEFEEVHQGDAEVRAVFDISRVGRIAGCYVTSGKITRGSIVRVVRDGDEVWSGEITTLKRFKDDVKSVSTGFECGIALAGYNEVIEGDELKVFELVQVSRA